MSKIFTSLTLSAGLLMAGYAQANHMHFNVAQTADPASPVLHYISHAEEAVAWVGNPPYFPETVEEQADSKEFTIRGVFSLNAVYHINNDPAGVMLIEMSYGSSHVCRVNGASQGEIPLGGVVYQFTATPSGSPGNNTLVCSISVTAKHPQPVNQAIVNINNQTQ